ncbi:MAG: toast rack family protein [candidate division Zixibacteria bacterium]|nr:toast rack family protein [candidate division Zixibacteria bacterium]MDH4035038.1 toast rack family protein [candidate division Zixibacteria bacterium]
MVRRLTTITIVLILVAAVAVVAGRIEHFSKEIEAEGAKKVDVVIDLAAGEFYITTKDMAQVATVEVEYDSRRIECVVEYNVHGSTGELLLESALRRKRNIDTEENRWEVVLSDRYPMTLEMEVGACDAEIDLGGIPLTELMLEVGAASGEIDFSEPNPERLGEIDIEAGAASVAIMNIGNANFEQFSFEGGAGSFELDFRGDYKDEAEISIEIGLGSAEIILPRDIPVRVETGDPGWFSTVDFHNDDLDEVDDGVYESDDFEDADVRIYLDLEVGLGSIDIYFKR